MWILCINLKKYVKIDPKMLKNDGLERSWRHFGPMLGTKRRQEELVETPRAHLGGLLGSLGSVWGGFGALWGSSWGLLGSILEPWASKNGAQMASGSGFVDIAKTLKFLMFFNTI